MMNQVKLAIDEESWFSKWCRTAQWDSTHRCGRGPMAFLPQPALGEAFALTEVDDMAIDKRKALQPVLDSIEKGWQITKASPLNPDDLETECIFQHRAGRHEQVRIVIDNSLFRLSNISELQDLVRSVIKPGPNIYLARP